MFAGKPAAGRPEGAILPPCNIMGRRLAACSSKLLAGFCLQDRACPAGHRRDVDTDRADSPTLAASRRMAVVSGGGVFIRNAIYNTIFARNSTTIAFFVCTSPEPPPPAQSQSKVISGGGVSGRNVVYNTCPQHSPHQLCLGLFHVVCKTNCARCL